ncbi:MAG TPA: purine-binding chemotaxis protein CheW [Chromatiaceae bacterium]|nr:purine-binding chemotaxis protein CheW [Chromatiaceae bacterium]
MAEDSQQMQAQVLETLADYARRSLGQEHKVPATMVKEEDWQGLAWILDGVKLVTAMDEVRELLPYPSDITRVPGTKEWMLGLANVRGELLPIVDLQQFLGGAPVAINDRCRVLVIRNRGASSGLLVATVIGLRHLPVERQIPDAEFEGVLGQYVYDVFALEDGVWPVFSMAALANDERFLSAAR